MGQSASINFLKNVYLRLIFRHMRFCKLCVMVFLYVVMDGLCFPAVDTPTLSPVAVENSPSSGSTASSPRGLSS